MSKSNATLLGLRPRGQCLLWGIYQCGSVIMHVLWNSSVYGGHKYGLLDTRTCFEAWVEFIGREIGQIYGYQAAQKASSFRP